MESIPGGYGKGLIQQNSQKEKDSFSPDTRGKEFKVEGGILGNSARLEGSCRSW